MSQTRNATGIGTSKEINLIFGKDLKIRISLFQGPKSTPGLDRLIKKVKIDSTNNKPVKSVNQWVSDGIPIEKDDLESEVQIGDEKFPIESENIPFLKQLFLGRDSSLKILGFTSIDDRKGCNQYFILTLSGLITNSFRVFGSNSTCISSSIAESL